MADWEKLREVGHEASPPPFESLVNKAGKRDRRARVVVLTATLAVATTLGFGVALVNDDEDAQFQPVKDPSPSISNPSGDVTLPDGVQALPGPDPGSTFASLGAGRYRISLSDTLAFDVDVPDRTSAHDDGLFLASGPVILKTEVAGEEYGVPRDPCTAHSIDPVGPTLDDLVQAIGDLPVYQVSRPEPVELGGAEGTYLEARIPRTYDASQCADRGSVQLPGNPTTAVGSNRPLPRALVDPRRRRTASRRPAELLGMHHRPARPRRHDDRKHHLHTDVVSRWRSPSRTRPNPRLKSSASSSS